MNLGWIILTLILAVYRFVYVYLNSTIQNFSCYLSKNYLDEKKVAVKKNGAIGNVTPKIISRA